MAEIKENDTKQGTASRRWMVFARLIFGVALMVLLISRVDISQLFAGIASVDLFYLAVMFVLPHLMLGINTFKWKMFLRELDIRQGFGKLFGLYLIATFFNNLLPTMVGGDAVRAYVLGKDIENTSAVAAATFMERLVGFAGLVSLVPLILLAPAVSESYPSLWLLAPACLVGFVLATTMVLSPRLDPIWRRLRAFPRLERLFDFLAKTRKAVYQAARSVTILITTYLLSLLFYLGAAATVWAAAVSLGAEVSLLFLFMTVPIVLLAGMLPVSLNGLGITEAGFALILQLAGVDLVDAVAVGLLLRGRLLVTALLGGLLFLSYRAGAADAVSET